MDAAIQRKKRKSLAFTRIADTYILGSILKITLTDFVTYDYVEFSPGPSLNMVIGPNGTGKSTIVCAIALGLGGKPEILGRAKELKEFVKKNKEQAMIEIELKTEDGSVIVERSFKQNANTSTWKLDGGMLYPFCACLKLTFTDITFTRVGKTCSEKHVKEFIHKLNIQLTPKDLLTETERAAGDPSLLAAHTKLIDLGKKLQQLESTFTTDTATLETLEKKQALLQEQVTRLREREKHLREAKLLNMAIPLRAYDELKEQFQGVKEKKDEIEKMKRECEEKVKPVSVLVTKIKSAAVKAKEEYKESQKTIHRDGVTQLERTTKRISDLEDEEAGHNKNIKNAKKLVAETEFRMHAAVKKQDELTKELEHLRAELESQGLMSGDGSVSNMQNSPEVLEITRQINLLNQDILDVTRECSDVCDVKGPVIEEIRGLTHHIGNAEREINNMKTIGNQKLNQLQRFNESAYKGVQFLRSPHGLQFEKPVFEPICLGINPVSPEYAKALEAFIGYGRLTSFVTQTENDYIKLRDHFYDKMNLRVNVVCVTNIRDKFESAISEAEIKRLGFDGVLIDYVTGDPVLMSALMQYTPLHETPICLSQNTNFNFNRVDTQSNVKNYVHGGYSYSVKGAYGSTSTKSESLKEAQILKMAVDIEREAALTRGLQDFQSRKADAEGQLKSLDAKEAILRTRDKDLRKEKTELTNKRKDLMNRRAAYDRKKVEV
ncbi:UNVERIFIED_CONTAM: Structural maintenance of chromosomes protein 5, partial [Siphonaria sp. JEL0065]